MGCWPYFDPLMSKKTTRSHTKFVDIYKVKTFSSKLVVSVLNLKKKKKNCSGSSNEHSYQV